MPTYPASMPSTGFKKFGWEIEHNIKITRSPFSNQQQVTQFAGGYFIFTFELPPMERADAAVWQAFLAEQRGGYGTFYAWDPHGRSPRGSALGSPLVKGGSQTGNSLDTDGWNTSESGLLLPGDYIQIGSGSTAELKMVTQQVDSDGSGNATISFEPAIRTSPSNNSSIVTSNPVGVFRLLAGPSRINVDELIYGFTFTAHEAF